MSRFSDALTALAARAYPRQRANARTEHDMLVVRDCAREAIAHEGSRVLARECGGLLLAGMRVRLGTTALELRRAPWRAALNALTLPLATALLLIWTFGFVPRYDHWPLGEGWALLLGGSSSAVLGAALRSRWLTAGGATAVLVAAAAPYLGFGTEEPVPWTPSFFFGGEVDVGAASLLPTALLIAAGLSLPSRTSRSWPRVTGRLLLGIAPAAIAAWRLWSYTTPVPGVGRWYLHPAIEPIVMPTAPYPWPWVQAAEHLIGIIALALLTAVVLSWHQARTRPERALATGLVLVTIAYPVAWVATRTEALAFPWWMLNAPYPMLLTAVPALLALALIRRGARDRRA